MLDIYIMEIPKQCDTSLITHAERRSDAESCGCDRVMREKYAAWRLLIYAAEHSFHIDMRERRLYRFENHKWKCDCFEFSISHSGEYAAVAVSDTTCGVDMELIDSRRDRERLYKRVLTEREKEDFLRSPALNRNERIIKLWTAKESIFKCSAEDTFLPHMIEVSEHSVRSWVFTKNGKYSLSVCSEKKDEARLFEVCENGIMPLEGNMCLEEVYE